MQSPESHIEVVAVDKVHRLVQFGSDICILCKNNHKSIPLSSAALFNSLREQYFKSRSHISPQFPFTYSHFVVPSEGNGSWLMIRNVFPPWVTRVFLSHCF